MKKNKPYSTNMWAILIYWDYPEKNHPILLCGTFTTRQDAINDFIGKGLSSKERDEKWEKAMASGYRAVHVQISLLPKAAK
jgi:hypothetical protein